jgi:hypothetical protein
MYLASKDGTIFVLLLWLFGLRVGLFPNKSSVHVTLALVEPVAYAALV